MARLPQAERRDQLVAAAITVMTRDGVRAATTRAVVNEADTSLSVFHYCFDSKRALMEEVLRALVRRSADRAAEASQELPPGPGAIGASLRAYFTHVREHPADHQLTYDLTQYCLRHEDLAHLARLQYDLYASTIRARLVDAGLDGRLDTQVVARYLAVVVDGLTLDWLVRRDDASSAAVLETTIAHVESLLA